MRVFPEHSIGQLFSRNLIDTIKYSVILVSIIYMTYTLYYGDYTIV